MEMLDEILSPAQPQFLVIFGSSMYHLALFSCESLPINLLSPHDQALKGSLQPSHFLA